MTTHPIKRGDLIQSKTAEGWTIYDERTDSLHVLNAAAKAIWDLCDGSTTPEEISSAIAEVAGLSHEEASDHVDQTLRSLSDAGLLDGYSAD